MDLKSALDRHPRAARAFCAIEIDGSDEALRRAGFRGVGRALGRARRLRQCRRFHDATRHPLSETSTDEFDVTTGGNLRTTFLACKAAMTLLEQGDTPSLVNIASGLGAYIRPQYGPYAASKAGMIALTKTFALEHAPRVRANAVAPGPVDTAFLRGGTGRSDEDGAPTIDFNAYNAMIPMRRIAVPEDIVGPVMFLLGPDSAYMTGQTLWVNGGAYMP